MQDQNVYTWDVSSFLKFGMTRTTEYWLKMLGATLLALLAGLLLPILIGVAFFYVLPFYLALVLFKLAVAVCMTAILYGYLANVLHLANGRRMDFKAFFPPMQPLLHLLVFGVGVGLAGIIAFLVPLLVMIYLFPIGILLGLVMIVVLIPFAIKYMIMFSLVPWLIVDRQVTLVQAIEKSIRMTEGHKMEIFGGLATAWVICMIVNMIPLAILFTFPFQIFVYAFAYMKLTDQIPSAAPEVVAAAPAPVAVEPPAGPVAPA